jgi:hypothetical protein
MPVLPSTTVSVALNFFVAVGVSPNAEGLRQVAPIPATAPARNSLRFIAISSGQADFLEFYSSFDGLSSSEGVRFTQNFKIL